MADLTGAFRLARMIREFAPQVVHAWQPLGCMPGLFAAAVAGVPYRVVSVRTLQQAKRLAEFGRYAPFTHAVCSTRSLRQSCVEFGVPDKFLTYLPDGGDSVASASAAPTTDPPTFVSIGPLGPQGRLFDLIWACDVLQVVRGRFALLVKGTIGQLDATLRFVHQVEMADRLRLAGNEVTNADVFRGALAAIFPGDDNVDAGPITAALAAGISVIASDTVGHRELIEHDRTGLLYSLGNRGQLAKLLRRVYDSPDLATRLSQAARENAVNTTTMRTLYAAFYQRIVAG
jgi:glycosyltransferase involved in cell wall biosynthesis